MPKRKSLLPEKSQFPQRIEPTAAYTNEQVRRLLDLGQSTLTRETRAGRLRYSLRSGRRYYLGAWLIEWIVAGEVRKEA